MLSAKTTCRHKPCRKNAPLVIIAACVPLALMHVFHNYKFAPPI